MADDLFHAAHVKLRRARKHTLSVNDEMDIQGAAHAEFLAAWSAVRGGFVPETEINPNRLDEVACCVGDAVHNLRAALDLLASEVVERSPDGNPNQVHFPFAETAAGLTEKTDKSPTGGAIRGKNFHRARQDAQDLVLALGPHGEPHGNALLWGLHRLDLIDKHQDILSLATKVSSAGLYFRGVEMKGARIDGGMLLVFAPGSLFAGHEVVATLNLLAGCVEDTIERFTSLGW